MCCIDTAQLLLDAYLAAIPLELNIKPVPLVLRGRTRHQFIHCSCAEKNCIVRETGVHQSTSKPPSMPPPVISGSRLRLTLLAVTTLVLLVGLTFAATNAIAREAPLYLVAHPDVATRWLNRDTTRAIFAMRQRTWPDGQAVRVFVLSNNNPVHARFTKEQLAVYPHQLQLAWDRMVFSGTGQAPDRVNDQEEMRERVASTPGAIGYLEKEYLDDSVQVISME
jgi:hypothetical protein